MPPNLTFIDCPACRKRIRSNAEQCHHCHWQRRLPDNVSVSGGARERKGREDVDANDEGFVPDAGYDTASDDFDYDEFIANELPSGGGKRPTTKRWIWVTAWVLIIVTLLPYLLYLSHLVRFE